MGNNVEDYGDIEFLFGFWGVGAFIIGGIGVLLGFNLYELNLVTTAIFIFGALGCMLGGKKLSVPVFTLLFAITCGVALCIPVVFAMSFAVSLNSAPYGLFLYGATLLAFINLYLFIKYIKEA